MERSGRSKLVTGLVLLGVGAALLVWALSGKNSSSTESNIKSKDIASVKGADSSTSASSDQSVSNTNQTTAATIVFTNDGFSPQELEVKVGATVAVKNESSQNVQFSSDDHPTHRLNQGMNLRVLAPGESGMFIADKIGSWGFHDHINDSFTGTLIVK
jgi:plastocyanin